MKSFFHPRKWAALALLTSLAWPVWSHDVGLQLYSLRNQMAEDFSASIAQVKAWGITSVEGGGNLHGLSLNQFKSILDEHQISIVSVDTHYEELRDNPIAVAYKAKFFGAKYATVYWIPHDGPFDLADANTAIEVFNRAGELLAANGITLQYHPHGYEFAEHPDGTLLDYMIKNVTAAKFQMDVFWIKQGGYDPVDFLNRYPTKFTSLHLKDRAHGTPDSKDGKADIEASVALGTGDIDIAKVVDVAKQLGIKYFFIEDESSRVLQQVPQSVEYLKQID